MELTRILTICSNSAPASGPAQSGVGEFTDITCQANWPDEVREIYRAAELHQGNVVEKCGDVVVTMYDYFGHVACYFINIRSSLSLSSKVEGVCTFSVSGK